MFTITHIPVKLRQFVICCFPVFMWADTQTGKIERNTLLRRLVGAPVSKHSMGANL